jgi:PIN domain nuclease of toxin-antitoxin system
LGKLDLKLPLIDLITSQQQKNRIQLLPISLPHILTLADLPLFHRDPFDRLLIAQAKVEQTPLITGDPAITNYPVQVAW